MTGLVTGEGEAGVKKNIAILAYKQSLFSLGTMTVLIHLYYTLRQVPRQRNPDPTQWLPHGMTSQSPVRAAVHKRVKSPLPCPVHLTHSYPVTILPQKLPKKQHEIQKYEATEK